MHSHRPGKELLQSRQVMRMNMAEIYLKIVLNGCIRQAQHLFCDWRDIRLDEISLRIEITVPQDIRDVRYQSEKSDALIYCRLDLCRRYLLISFIIIVTAHH